MSCQVFVLDGVTLTIERGTTIYAMPVGSPASEAPALVVEQGGRLMAEGTAADPITFTAFNPEETDDSTVVTDTGASVVDTVLETRGKWGGLILLGRAPTSAGSYASNFIEGISGRPYGGSDPADSSGSLKYVRVWHGGAAIGADNEINGITFGGVGSGTTVEHCEVAFNLDDGFEFFGGTVNVKWLSVLFVGDDAFDSDEGYQGKGQFLFAMTGEDGNHGTEMDSKTGGNLNSQPRSHPAFYSMTILGGGSAASGANADGLMRLREGTGGSFGNVVLAYGSGIGVRNDDCGSESRGITLLPEQFPDFLFFSPNNVIYGASTPFSYGSGAKTCSSAGFAARLADPGFAGVSAACLDYTCLGSSFSPLPTAGSEMCSGAIDSSTDPFYEGVACKGAFASPSDNWLSEYSWLACAGKMAGSTCAGIAPSPFAQLQADGQTIARLGGDVDSATTLSADTSYLLTSQLFISASLTIPPGTTIYAMPTGQAPGDVAPAIVVEQGGRLIAEGTAVRPITMTTVLSEAALASSEQAQTDTANPGLTNLGERGKWGGLVLLGRAPTSAGSYASNFIEGISGKPYGGSDPGDSSGSLKYVRVWHGGAIIGADNEINGITFGGVGSGTTVEHCEVALNLDDGFEFFGGTVNVKWLSALFVGDDAFDVDEGYQGSGQFLFAMVGVDGNHGTEIDSKTGGNLNSQPRSHPAFYSMTIIGGGTRSARDSNAIMRLREGTGGKFGNVILANAGGQHTGVEVRDCGSETRTQDLPAPSVSIGQVGTPDSGYLFFSKNNVVAGANPPFSFDRGCPDEGWQAVYADPGIYGCFYEDGCGGGGSGRLDPRPTCGGSGWTGVDDPPPSFFAPVSYKGAFGAGNLWLEDWSYLAEQDRLATSARAASSTSAATSARTRPSSRRRRTSCRARSSSWTASRSPSSGAPRSTPCRSAAPPPRRPRSSSSRAAG
ncbi:hypothetical protein EMIHUDRAFT_443725 [Emiliania huxleyi CCMP1516]|uniref:Lipoprotein n=2 Tax=Emiliania huxleyi TaxID=2903 RepID=A0A0D3JNG6_EMIH1|nr:hypothetical protein EMIHUDRAFT_443725 [Emiliania huxleyi CCMP1516]EOD25051.1 hypothetical protein EMIHUDRAFT_443725 [Emiliania huxleyi CCMP1516]|eukprot:XP_005777480.1 hypothetical protein EMIHUDRAFT_443725 [Emiliania huxleyi CCMP1516]